MKKRIFGFTLAEVLITLGIIGVVAAMTMPTVISANQKRHLEVATKKFYSMMSQAVKKYMADEGIDDLRLTDLADKNYEDIESDEAIESIRNFVTKYLKVVKECDYEANDCFADSYKNLDGGSFSNSFGIGISDYVLADGSVIRIGYYGHDYPIELFVDVNGKKGPNKVGYDFWSMSIFYDGIIDESNLTPENRKNSNYDASQTRKWRFESCQDGNYGGCFGHFMENGFKIDY